MPRLVLLLLCLLLPHAAQAVPDTMEQRAKACTACHGEQGRSRPDGYVPRLAGKPAGYLLEQLQAFREGRRQHGTMARLLEHLDEPMLRALAAHFAALDVPYPPPASPPLQGAAARRAEQLVRAGDAQLKLPACASCHGAALTGVAPAVPGLLGLPRDYLQGQLGAWRNGVRHARGPDCMAQVAQALPLADVALVSQWLAAQPVPANAAAATVPPARWPLDCGSVNAPPAAEPRPPAEPLAARGAVLARIGHCAGCHTAPGGAAYAGGRGITTPFGKVYAGNLTPDADTGLGRWSAADFWRAMHEGRSRDGRRLVPVFPYTSYTHVTPEDSDALFAYFRSLPPVRQAQRPHELRYPYGTQAALALWQWLYFEPDAGAAARATPTTGPARGAYLVNGLGHCAACHAPRNRWGAPAAGLAGGVMPAQGWYAPSLHPQRGSAITREDLVALLRSGRHAHGSASGPMAGVVMGSTQHWPEADLQAAAAYLLTLPAEAAAPAGAAPGALLSRGARLYKDRCADCHGAQGQGSPGAYPPLAGNPSVLAPDVRNLVQVLRFGHFGPTTATVPRPYGMPPQELSDADMAAVITHLRQAWGHRAGAVSELEVLKLSRP